MLNPYTPFSPAIENFFGREDILATFRDRLEPGSYAYRLARHFLLVGDGGIGKTSLLERMKRESWKDKSAVHTITIDVDNYGFDVSSLVEDLYHQLPQPDRLTSRTKAGLGLSLGASKKEVLNRLVQGLRDGVAIGFPPTIEVGPGAFFRDVGRGQNLAQKLASWCGDLLQLSAESEDAIILFFDQIGKLFRIPGGRLVLQSLVELMAEGVKNRLRNLLLVMAVRPERKGTLEHCFRQEIFHPRLVTRLPLYPLGKDVARTAISEPARRQGVHLSVGLVDQVLKRCGDHPYFLQIACYRLWEYLADKGLRYQIPVKLPEAEVEEVVREGQSAMFHDFSSEEQYLLKVLALNWPSPLTRMQLKERIEESGYAHIVPVDDVLTALVEHKHRPIKYYETAKAYTITHDLFAEHILRNECSRDQRELTVLQTILHSALQVYEFTGALLTEAQLERIWQLRDRLTWRKDCISMAIFSEAKITGFADRWAEWFLSSEKSAVRLAAAEEISGTISERVRELLLRLQEDSNEEVRRASHQALSRSSRPWTWGDAWDYEMSRI